MELNQILEQGRLLRHKNKVEAQSSFEACLQQAEAESQQVIASIAATELALELIDTAHEPALQQAKSLLLKAESWLTDCVSCQLETAYIQYSYGLLNLQQGNHVDALSHLQTAAQNYGEDAVGLSLVDDALGQYYAALGEPRTASMYLRRSLSRRQSPEFDRDKALSYSLLGKINLQLENYEQAENFFEQSLDLALQLDSTYARLQAMTGLGQMAIAQAEWETAIIMLQECLQLLQEPIDLSKAAYLYTSLAEAFLGSSNVDRAQRCIETEAIPRFQHLQDRYGLAISKRLLGDILSRRLLNGTDSLTEEAVEKAEDYLLDASMLFEQFGRRQEYASTLYDLACLYNIYDNSNHKYQYQGKAVRTLELALTALEQSESDTTKLTNQIETLLNQSIGSLSH